MKKTIYIEGKNGIVGQELIQKIKRDQRWCLVEKPQAADLIMLAIRHGESEAAIKKLKISTEQKIIDLTTNHRANPDWVYGLPELNADKIKGAARVANPGCYATGIALGILPIQKECQEKIITVFGISGWSGAGKNAAGTVEKLKGYNLGADHNHQKELKINLQIEVRLKTMIAHFKTGMQLLLLTGMPPKEKYVEKIISFYKDHPLIQVSKAEITDDLHKIGEGEGNVKIYPSLGSEQLEIVVQLCNIGKGAAHQAMQNADLMLN
jgi:N-acetyl-gamma-glutamylphosphate reductase